MRQHFISALIGSLCLAACGSSDPVDPGMMNECPAATDTQVPASFQCLSNFTPPAIVVPAGTYTEDMTWGADRQFLLQGGVFIGDGSSATNLTVRAGTQIRGEEASKAFLVIQQNSKIEANGTAASPILFTSSKAEGSRGRGDWGGLVINGNAPVNCGQGNTTCEGEAGTGAFGGSDPADSSGTLRYLRVEFAGNQIDDENELNGIAFQGVGSGTTIEFVHIHKVADDGIEMFGGTANLKNILLTGIGDDSLDWTFGWQGMGQFIVAQQHADDSDQGIEADNNSNNNSAMPRSRPVLSNLTLIGSPDSAASDIGVLLREGTAVEIHSSVVAYFNESCLDIDKPETFDNSWDGMGTPTGELLIRNSIFYCPTPAALFGQEMGDPWSIDDYIMAQMEGNSNENPMLTAPLFDGANASMRPNFMPQAGSPLMSGGAAPSASFFSTVTFRGGIDPSSDWTEGWTSFPEN